MSLRLGILLIATRKYKQFIPNIVRKIDKHVLLDQEIGVVIFSDEQVFPRTTNRLTLSWSKIPDSPWPAPTLHRYKFFSGISEYIKKFPHLLYVDVDMDIVEDVGDEIITNGLLAIRHPGTYATDRWGSPGNKRESTSWFPEEFRRHYYCGGVQGGAAEYYLEACKTLAARIEEDERNSVMAEWHDETHWNKWCNYDQPSIVTELPPSYCMPENKETQVLWGLGEFVPKIIALDKNHAEMRS